MGFPVVVDKDLLHIEPFPGYLLTILDGNITITASGNTMIGESKVCVVGDESSVKIPASYTTQTFTTPGEGTVTITLKEPQKAQVAKDGGNALILANNNFVAKFTPSVKATTSDLSATPDSTAFVLSTGTFVTSQTFVTAN